MTDEKFTELTAQQQNIIEKGARYLTKFILFPVRLLFTLNKINTIGTNADSVKNYLTQYHDQTATLVQHAFHWRDQMPKTEITEALPLLKKH